MSVTPPPTLEHSSSADSNTSISSSSTQLLTPPLAPVEVAMAADLDLGREAAKGTLLSEDSTNTSCSKIFDNAPLVTSPAVEDEPASSSQQLGRQQRRRRPSLPIDIPVAPPQVKDSIFGNFSFGSCPSGPTPLANTPIAELGPFEYPDDLIIPRSSRSSISLNTPLSRRGSMARSVTPTAAMEEGIYMGRRGSIPFREVEGQAHLNGGGGGSFHSRRSSLAQHDSILPPLPPRFNSPSPVLPPYKPISSGTYRPRQGSSSKPNTTTSTSPDRAKLEAYRLDLRRGSLPIFAPMPMPISPSKPLQFSLRGSVDSGRPVLRHSLSFKFGSMSLESHTVQQQPSSSPRLDHGPSPGQSPVQSPVDESIMRRRTSRGPLHFSISSRTSAPIPPSLLAKRDKLGTRVEE